MEISVDLFRINEYLRPQAIKDRNLIFLQMIFIIQDCVRFLSGLLFSTLISIIVLLVEYFYSKTPCFAKFPMSLVILESLLDDCLPIPCCKLHRDELPEIYILAGNLIDIEPGEKVRRHHSHFSPSKAAWRQWVSR